MTASHGSPDGGAGHAAEDRHGEVCVTCSDQAVPARITRLLDDGMALVETEGATERVSVALVEARVGDVVLVHAKEAISRIEESDDATG